MPDKKVNNDENINSDKELENSTNNETGKDKDNSGQEKNVRNKKAARNKDNSEVEETEKDPKKPVKKSPERETKDFKSSDDSSQKKPAKKPPAKKNIKDKTPDSNYQVSLVDENTLKIKIKTDKGVSLNSTVGGKNVLPEEVEGLLNKLGTGKDGEIEIEISINPEKKSTETVENPDIIKEKEQNEQNEDKSLSAVLTPNPEVTKIVEQTTPLEEELTEEEILREKIGRKSPYNIYRRIYSQNFQVGLVGGVIIYLIAIFSFYAVASKDEIVEENPQQRLIVLQDLPDPKIKLENIEDPNAPVKEEETEEDGTVPKRIPIKRNFNRPPIVKRPQVDENKDTTSIKDTSGLADTNTVKDTTSASGYPDSLMVSYSGNEIGLIMNYPPSWKLVDSREINVNIEKFMGVVLSDTTAPDKGTFNMFVKLDEDNKPFDRDKYKYPFAMNDSNLTGFNSDTKEIAGKKEYYFYIFGLDHNLSITASVTIDKFDSYKPAIDAVVKSISFAPKPPQ